jgi:hypothetical protein
MTASYHKSIPWRGLSRFVCVAGQVMARIPRRLLSTCRRQVNGNVSHLSTEIIMKFMAVWRLSSGKLTYKKLLKMVIYSGCTH